MATAKRRPPLFPQPDIKFIQNLPWFQCWWHQTHISSRYGIPVKVRGNTTVRKGCFANPAAAFAWIDKKRENGVITQEDWQMYKDGIEKDLELKQRGFQLVAAPSTMPDHPHWASYLNQQDYRWADKTFDKTYDPCWQTSMDEWMKRNAKIASASSSSSSGGKHEIQPLADPETEVIPLPEYIKVINPHAKGSNVEKSSSPPPMEMAIWNFMPTEPEDPNSVPPQSIRVQQNGFFTPVYHFTRMIPTIKDGHLAMLFDQRVDNTTPINQRVMAMFPNVQPPLCGNVMITSTLKKGEPWLTDVPRNEVSNHSIGKRARSCGDEASKKATKKARGVGVGGGGGRTLSELASIAVGGGGGGATTVV